MRIAIIDWCNQDIGLKILFPDADYYIDHIEVDKTKSFQKYTIQPRTDWSKITDQNYDYLFIIISVYDAKPGTRFFKKNCFDSLERQLEIINTNTFKKVCVFDNYDYDYDPNTIISNPKIDLFFKRFYNKTKTYSPNVVPFPFIMFGDISLIEKIDVEPVTQSNATAHNRIFFSGTLFEHNDPEIQHYRSRRAIYAQIYPTIYNPGNLPYVEFLKQMRESRFALDLNGVGDPNKRTFEILSQGTLRIGEYNDLKWPFDEEFSPETIFRSSAEFMEKCNTLNQNHDLYRQCLERQKTIYHAYFNKTWIKSYLLKQVEANQILT